MHYTNMYTINNVQTTTRKKCQISLIYICRQTDKKVGLKQIHA